MRRIVICLLGALLLSGCAEGSSIYHLRSVKAKSASKSEDAVPNESSGESGRSVRWKQKASILTVDAKQRNVLINSKLQMCAEAAPDVFSAINAAAALEADVASKSGKASASIAETVGTIERTQTINLLRESMFRTCERYLNGAIGPAQLVVQAARDQRAMVKILAIEQLTRTARPPSTILSAAPVSATIVDGDTAAKLIKDASAERSAAKTALDQSSADLAKARAKGKCDVVSQAPAEDATDPKLSDWSACKAAEVTNAERKKDYDAATARFDKALAVVQQVGTGASAAVLAGRVSNGAGGGALDAAAIASVANAVTAIIREPDIDEPLMFCISLLSPYSPIAGGALVKDGDTAATCRGILKARAQQDEKVREKYGFAGGLSIADFRATLASPKIRSLNTYLTKPTGTDQAAKAERKRRIDLVIQAARALNIALTPPDVSQLATNGDPSLVEAIIDQVLAMENSASGKQDLAQ